MTGYSGRKSTLLRLVVEVIAASLIAVAVSGCVAGQPITAANPRTATSCPQAAHGKPCITLSSPTPTATPGPIAYIQPSSVSFLDSQHGWVVGHACDATGTCRPGVARTEDGGAT